MTPELEAKYMSFVNTLGVERAQVVGDNDPHTDQMSFVLLHMVTGMCTEAGEIMEIILNHLNGDDLNVSKLMDEMGDLFFYLCGAVVDTKIKMDTILVGIDPGLHKFVRNEWTTITSNKLVRFNDIYVPDGLIYTFIGLVIETSRLLDLLKKHMAYHRQLDFDGIKQLLGRALTHLANACIELGTNFDDIIVMNMAKLQKRYPGGYNHRNANNRDRAAEADAQNKAVERVTNVDGECVVRGSEKDDRYGPNAFTKHKPVVDPRIKMDPDTPN